MGANERLVASHEGGGGSHGGSPDGYSSNPTTADSALNASKSGSRRGSLTGSEAAAEEAGAVAGAAAAAAVAVAAMGGDVGGRASAGKRAASRKSGSKSSRTARAGKASRNVQRDLARALRELVPASPIAAAAAAAASGSASGSTSSSDAHVEGVACGEASQADSPSPGERRQSVSSPPSLGPPPSPEVVVISLRNGLALSRAQQALVEKLYASCSKVTLTLLHAEAMAADAIAAGATASAVDGSSRTSPTSLILHAESADRTGQVEDPTVLRIDAASSVFIEATHARSFARVMDFDFVTVARGPRFVNADGAEISGAHGSSTTSAPTSALTSASTSASVSNGSRSVIRRPSPTTFASGDLGALVLEVAGGVWLQGDLRQAGIPAGDRRSLSTYKQRLAVSLAPDDREDRSGELNVLAELWKFGGPLFTLAFKTARRSESCALEAEDGLVACELRRLREVIASCDAAWAESASSSPQLTGLLSQLESMMHGGGDVPSPAWLASWYPLITSQYGSDEMAASLVMDSR